MTGIRDIGVDVNTPTGEWDGDDNCPFYGSLRVRGQIIEGSVSTTGMPSSRHESNASDCLNYGRCDDVQQSI